MSNFKSEDVASVVFAAGKGSRMVGYEGNKTLLPLIAGASAYEGSHPLLVQVLSCLPPGPKGIVVNYRREEVRKATQDFGAAYILQPDTNGTGGALLAARSFLESVSRDAVVITMGDVPLIRPGTYQRLVQKLEVNEFVILAFSPEDKAQYGMLEMEGSRVISIVEWKYWRDYSPERREALRFCNAGVYAAGRVNLIKYLDRLAGRPHHVRKQRGDQWVEIEEFFLTDLVEMMGEDRVPTGIVEASEDEVMGVDTPEALRLAQLRYAERSSV